MSALEPAPPAAARHPLEVSLWICASACLLFSLVSISLVQFFLGLAIVLLIVLWALRRRRLRLPGFAWPLGAYVVWSLVASALSRDPETSFIDSRDLLLVLVVPVVLAAFVSVKSLKTGLWALWASAVVSSVYSIIHYVLHHGPGERARGFMGHYMTQAGLLMLFGSLALALALFLRGGERRLWGLGFVLGLVALAVTLTRSAWIGLTAAAVLLLLIYKPKLLVLVPAVVGLFFLIAPRPMKQRALSIFSRHGFSNEERIEYYRAGLKIIGENPFHGTGPDTVDKVFQYPRYGLSAQARRNVHLHSDVIQIAAERGLPGLAAWLAFLAWAAIGLVRMVRSAGGRLKALAAAALAVLAALFVGGLFEYNFGDSEITSLFYFLITLPFALEALEARRSPAGPEGRP
jgi:O-antigen ligase